MESKQMNHQMAQLASMFCQLGEAAAQLVRDHRHTDNLKEHVAIAQEQVSTNRNEIDSEVIFEPI